VEGRLRRPATITSDRTPRKGRHETASFHIHPIKRHGRPRRAGLTWRILLATSALRPRCVSHDRHAFDATWGPRRQRFNNAATGLTDGAGHQVPVLGIAHSMQAANDGTFHRPIAPPSTASVLNPGAGDYSFDKRPCVTFKGLGGLSAGGNGAYVPQRRRPARWNLTVLRRKGTSSSTTMGH